MELQAIIDIGNCSFLQFKRNFEIVYINIHTILKMIVCQDVDGFTLGFDIPESDERHESKILHGSVLHRELSKILHL